MGMGSRCNLAARIWTDLGQPSRPIHATDHSDSDNEVHDDRGHITGSKARTRPPSVTNDTILDGACDPWRSVNQFDPPSKAGI